MRYGRRPWLDATIIHFRNRKLKRVVEIGSIRSNNVEGDGHAVMALAEHAESFITVDISPEATAIARELTSHWPHVQAVTMDGVEFLTLHNEPIDLLYLDGPDPSPTSHQFHLAAYQAAKRNLTVNSLILIDDCREGGKGELVIPAAMQDGYKMLVSGYMVLLGIT